MNSNIIPPNDELEVAAWVCYVHSLDGRSDRKVTDVPQWSNEFHKEKYVRRAKEIFEVIETHRNVSESLEEPERLITSSDVNKAGEAKASALWGGNQ